MSSFINKIKKFFSTMFSKSSPVSGELTSVPGTDPYNEEVIKTETNTEILNKEYPKLEETKKS